MSRAVVASRGASGIRGARIPDAEAEPRFAPSHERRVSIVAQVTRVAGSSAWLGGSRLALVLAPGDGSFNPVAAVGSFCGEPIVSSTEHAQIVRARSPSLAGGVTVVYFQPGGAATAHAILGYPAAAETIALQHFTPRRA